MNKAYIEIFCKIYKFPQETKETIFQIYSVIEESACLTAMLAEAEELLFSENKIKPELYLNILLELAEKINKTKYEVNLFFHISAAERLNALYEKLGIDEKIRFDTLEDISFKMHECYRVTGIYGLYTPAYLYGYYRAERFAFGRMQYEISSFNENAEIENTLIKKGDKVIKMHIPACDKPFDKAARLDSYKKAYAFFKNEFNTDKIPFSCNSWLLSPENEKFLSLESNIIDFMHEFKITAVYDNQNYHAFRIFGMELPKDLNELPENTSLMRGIKKRMLEGRGIQNGCGVFLFDGEKIIH